MKLINDMNLSPRWEQALTEAGYEAKHWSRLGPATAQDRVIMEYARTYNYVVLTNDLDFGAILAASGGNKPSVVQIRAADISPEMIGSKIIDALKQTAAELDSGALVTVDTDRTRIRILPLNIRGQ